MYLQFMYAWLTGDGDLHAKNPAVLRHLNGKWMASPVYDIPCTAFYDSDDTMALAIAGTRGHP